MLQDAGCRVYIDWLDSEMPDIPNKETAARIQLKIKESEYFVYLATENSSKSRWCPWEIGFADGKKVYDRIAIIPTQDNLGHFYGNEYLNLYNKIDVSSGHTGLAFFDTRGNGKWVRNL